jgi:EpsI family protein
MIENNEYNQRPVIVAAVAAGLLVLGFGLGYRVLAARLSAPVNTTPISPETLAQLPLQIGDWIGREVPLDEAIVRATDTDAHVNRRYLRHSGLESVSLYIATGVNARDLMPHRPEVCYTGSGWTLTKRDSMELPLSNGMKLPCNVLQFSRGALGSSKVMVLDYYIVDGQYCSDISLLRSKAWRGSGTVDYVVQVQIVTSVSIAQTADSARKIISDFASASAQSIADLFEDAVKDQSLDKGSFNAKKVYEEAQSG